MTLPAPDTIQVRLIRTVLYPLHVEFGARMVPFAGFEMPVQYAQGIKQEHLHTRNSAGLFDVSHMGQIRIRGARAAEALERLVPGDITGLPHWRSRYTLFTQDNGGICDDLMVTALPEELRLVVNAACREKDLQHVADAIGADCEVNMLSDHALLALQGPKAAAVLARLTPGVDELRFQQAGEFHFAGATGLITRSSYTGEDGFEISLPEVHAEALARSLLAEPEVAPAGLGARDSLRLEAGLCLYGQDIDETTTPVEAGLDWTIARRYRESGKGRFPGAERILRELRAGVTTRRVGLQPDGPVPVRGGAVLRDTAGHNVGRVTSGGYGPTVEAPIAMGYVESGLSRPGTELAVDIRNRNHVIRIRALPFIAPRYRR